METFTELCEALYEAGKALPEKEADRLQLALLHFIIANGIPSGRILNAIDNGIISANEDHLEGG